MNVTRGVRIESVQYWASGPVQVVLTPLWLMDDGSVAGLLGQEAVQTTQDKLSKRAIVNGRMDGQWGDKEVEEEVRASTHFEMRREDVTRETVVTEEPVRREMLRFADVTEIRWS